MESICLINGFIYNLTGIWICETGSAGNDFFSDFAMVVAVVFGAEHEMIVVTRTSITATLLKQDNKR